MAVAAWLVWRRSGWWVSRASLCLFALQLSLSVAWSAIFFGFRSPGLAFAELLVLWFAIAATTISFLGRSTVAAVLFVPYLTWTTFAAMLNLAIWRMNS
jgi:tryptophan-rich sensory protein